MRITRFFRSRASSANNKSESSRVNCDGSPIIGGNLKPGDNTVKSLNHPQSRSRQQRQAGAPAPANRSLASISNSIQRHQGISAPSVYRPGNAALAAPAVHRPDASTAVQRRQGVSAPPVYRSICCASNRFVLSRRRMSGRSRNAVWNVEPWLR
jgi:hypothetical protein